MEEIIRLVMFAQSDRFTVSDLCEQFGISRKTGITGSHRVRMYGVRLFFDLTHDLNPSLTIALSGRKPTGAKTTSVAAAASQASKLSKCPDAPIQVTDDQENRE